MKIFTVWPSALYLVALLLFTGCSKNNTEQKTMKETDSTTFQDPHSYARPSEAVMTHLSWEGEVDFDKKEIKGIARITIKSSGQAEHFIVDTKNLDIEKVTVGKEEKTASYKLGEKDKFMGSPLSIEISPETAVVNVYYHTTQGAEALQWLNPVQTAGDKYPFLFTQSEAILARTWIPLQDSPGIRFTYEATVKVPSNLLALMSAENPQKKNEEGVYKFKMDKPIPAYLMALAVGNLVFEPIGDKTGVYAEPEVIKKAAYELGEMDEMLRIAKDLYGPYRWGRYDVLMLPPSFPFGGMENPRLTFATPTILAGDRSLTSLIAHEMAHSWSGNLVTNATWNDFWLNEGFTVYFETRIMEEMYGRDYSEMLASLSLQELKDEIEEMKKEGNARDTELKLNLKGRNPDDGMTNIAYDKGYFFLRTLEEKVGRKTFDTFLSQYFEDNAFKSMNTEDFVEYTNKNLFEKNDIAIDSALYKNWIYGEGLPKNMPVVKSERFLAVDSAVNSWKGGTLAKNLHTDEWTTHEWLHFIHELPEVLTTTQMADLDQAFGFTDSGNSEILAAWFIPVIHNKYASAYNSLEKFLVNVGRRKFLMPLYGEMIKTEDGKKMALEIYKKARPNYHYVAVNSLDELLNYSE